MELYYCGGEKCENLSVPHGAALNTASRVVKLIRIWFGFGF